MKITNKTLQNYTVLYVEDNHEISEEIVFFLEPLVKRLHTSFNGEEGLDIFKQFKPDIIISDIQMPVMNGIDMIRNIRSIDKNVPIIITTAFNESGYLLDAINLQVDKYILKPLELKKLLEALKKVVEVMELRKELSLRNKLLQDMNENLTQIVHEKTAKLEYLYSHDATTDLPNYVSLLEEIEKPEYTYTLLLDIANFSLINKEYGKIIANAILKEAGHHLKKHATQNYRLFKVESDHFVFLSKEKSFHEVEEFCKQIISYFDTKFININSIEININFTCGISPIQEQIFPLIDAEYALENAKELGSRYYFINEDISEEIYNTTEKIKWLKITQELVQNEQIIPYYQPIMDAKTNEIVKYEVLARGIYQSEIIPPYYFIENAERLGIITAITRIIINKSFTYLSGSDIKFSINLTQRDLLDKTFIVFLEEKLEKFNINPKNVTFEILENITIGFQHTLLIEHLKSLKKMGFEIAIDDFGMDNSNFSRFMEVEFDYIKLDALFIKNIDINKKDKILVTAVTALAHSFGMKTIAEYVESELIQEIAIGCDVDLLQGYHIGKPSAAIQKGKKC